MGSSVWYAVRKGVTWLATDRTNDSLAGNNESPTHCFTVSKDFVLGFGHFPSNLIPKGSKFSASYCTDYTRDNSMQENKQRLAKKVPQATTEFQHFLRTFQDF